MFNNAHFGRKQIVLRWLAAVMLVVGAAFWMVWFHDGPPRQRLPSTRNMQPPDLDIPGKNLKENLARGLQIVEKPPERKALTSLDMSFLPSPGVASEDFDKSAADKMETITLGLLFIGENINFAMINGQIYEQGEKLPNGRRLLAVTEGGVLLGDHSEGQWISWQNKGTILERPDAPEESDESGESGELGEPDKPNMQEKFQALNSTLRTNSTNQ